MRIDIPERVQVVMRKLERAGAEPLLVGGFVRDRVMRRMLLSVRESKDVDMEVRGMGAQQLHEILRSFGRVDEVGVAFGVFKLTFHGGEQWDVSLPRRESKAGTGHRGFVVEPDSMLSIREAAARRDFTINSMGADSTGLVHDPFDGISDIELGYLSATSKRFVDDPLRVLRAMQFASRFGFKMDFKTILMAQELLPEAGSLSADRIWTEWSKWARGAFPSRGLNLLRQTTWLYMFPALAALPYTQQDPGWHPEGDVWEHTLLAVDQAAQIARDEGLDGEQTETLVLAALLHDVGKPETTERRGQHIISHGHAEAGAVLARTFLRRMRAPEAVVVRVSALVREHMVHTGARPSISAVRRLARRLAASGGVEQRTTVRMLALLCRADASGRHPAPPADPMAEWLAVAEQSNVTESRPEPILKGRHLMARGWPAGPVLGPILRQAFEAQLDGAFSDEQGAVAWSEANYASPVG